jgi:hypothetical protein
MALATKEPTGRIHLIPRYWGGEGANGDQAWSTAIRALVHIGKSDPVVKVIAEQIDDAWADCVESALEYGRALGPDAEGDVTNLEDDEYEDRMGKARVQS